MSHTLLCVILLKLCSFVRLWPLPVYTDGCSWLGAAAGVFLATDSGFVKVFKLIFIFSWMHWWSCLSETCSEVSAAVMMRHWEKEVRVKHGSAPRLPCALTQELLGSENRRWNKQVFYRVCQSAPLWSIKLLASTVQSGGGGTLRTPPAGGQEPPLPVLQQHQTAESDIEQCGVGLFQRICQSSGGNMLP